MNINYTTTEQSDRLINAGIPVSSADCYFYTKLDKQPKVLAIDGFDWSESPYIPCWSVGRLIEIIRECCMDYDMRRVLIETLVVPTTDNISALVELICYAQDELNGLDISKLED